MEVFCQHEGVSLWKQSQRCGYGCVRGKQLAATCDSYRTTIPQSEQATSSVIFVVDDDEAVVSSLQVLFESIGHEVRGYTSARSFLREFNTDLDVGGCIILDERMPEMSGRVLQKELTRRGCSMPVILYTGFAEVEYAVDLMRNGAFTVLQKPSNDRVLVAAVAEAL